MPDFIADDKARVKALKMLKQKVRLVSRRDVLCFSIACNTAHILLPELQALSKAPFVSMIEETAKRVYEDGRKKVGLLGTPSTIKYGLYQKALKKYGVSMIIPLPNDINILEKIIRNVLKGKILRSDAIRLEKIADDLKSRGATAILLGCTELPLVFPKNYSLPVYNSVEILAMALLRKYYRKEKV